MATPLPHHTHTHTKEDSRAGRKGHVERSMYTVKSTFENCLVRRHITDPQDSFLSELEETITDKAANFHLGATLHKPTSHICKRWNWAQHQERPALEGSQELPLAGEQQGQENSSNSFQGCRELYMLTAIITLSFLPSVYCSQGSDMCTWHDSSILFSIWLIMPGTGPTVQSPEWEGGWEAPQILVNFKIYSSFGAVVKNLPASAGHERDPGSIPESERSPEEEMATHSSILAWRIPWTEEPEGIQSMGLHRVGHDFALLDLFLSIYTYICIIFTWIETYYTYSTT